MPFQLQRVKRPQVRSDFATIQGGAVGEHQKQHLKPMNERLWKLVTMQAKAKFMKYPSPTASAWAHKKYVQMGGRFVDTAKETRKKKIQKALENRRKHKKDDD